MRYNTLTVFESADSGLGPNERKFNPVKYLYESTSFSKKNLRKMQNGKAWGPYSRYLRKPTPQAAPGLTQSVNHF